jgi:hypothetical protein
MKIQLLILSLFVVAALSHGRDNGENQVGRRRRQFRGSRQKENQLTELPDDSEVDEAVLIEEDFEKSLNTKNNGEKRRCGGRRRWGSRRRGSNGDEVQEGEGNENQVRNWHKHHSDDNENTEKTEDGNEGKFRHHHGHHGHHPHRHHHHHHHHHHHRNHTTTTTTTTTSTTPPPQENER